MHLISNKSNPIRPLESAVTLTCIVELPPVVELELSLLTVDVELSKDESQLLPNDSIIVSGRLHNYSTHLNSFGRTDSGTYTCTAIVRPGPNLTHVNPSLSTSNHAKISTGKVLYSSP